MELNDKLIALRKKKGLSQLDVAEILNVSRQAVSRWEVGTSYPSVDNLAALSKLYDIALDDLMNVHLEGELPNKEKEQAEAPEPLSGDDNADLSGETLHTKKRAILFGLASIVIIATIGSGIWYFQSKAAAPEGEDIINIDDMDIMNIESDNIEWDQIIFQPDE